MRPAPLHWSRAGSVATRTAPRCCRRSAGAEAFKLPYRKAHRTGSADLATSVEFQTEVQKDRPDEIAARKAGLGSKDTLRAAQKVIERDTPELVEAIAERLQGRVGNPELHANSGNISLIEQGRTKDIAAADGRYCLNDLHRAAGGEKRHGPSYWLANAQTRALIDEMATAGIPVVTSEGAAGGTYVAKKRHVTPRHATPAPHVRETGR